MKPDQWQKAFELKSLPRAGWLRKGITHPESVAAHSWGLSMLCLEFAPRVHPPLDLEKGTQTCTDPRCSRSAYR